MRVLFASDIHFPYESVEAWNLFLGLVPALAPDRIVLGGDVVDFYAVSHFLTDPLRRFSIQDDIDHAVKQLLRLRKAAPDARIDFFQGNHELRLQKYLFSKAAELSGLRCLTLPELLQFSKLEVKQWVETNQKYKIGRLWLLHGDQVVSSQINPARQLAQRLHVHALCGHVHKFSHHSDHGLGGKERGAWTNGCLCMLNPEYAYNPQWANGFTLIDFVDDGLFAVEPIQFFQHQGSTKVIRDGKLHQSRARV